MQFGVHYNYLWMDRWMDELSISLLWKPLLYGIFNNKCLILQSVLIERKSSSHTFP
jgi:hypothetical protein